MKLTPEEKIEYQRLTENAKQIRLRLEELENKPTIYGYARVSTHGQARDGNSLEAQEKELRANGAEEIVSDAFTGTKINRPELDKLMEKLRPGDTLIVTKLDRIARNLSQGVDLINSLLKKGINVHVLNMGLIDNTPTGKLISHVMLAFAEFERDMIVQRTQEGRAVAKTKPGYREGRPLKYSEEQMQHAVELLEDHTYSEVVRMTGISRSTLQRMKLRKG